MKVKEQGECVVTYICDLGCEMDNLPWWHAASAGKVEILKWLFENGYD